ncbi:XRCC4-like factor-domain-containing protein, partial [Bombardia bombarda]
HPSWRPLPAAVPGIPNLLVSANFTADSYNIHLTDLANLWVESLDRRPIVKRGLVEDTSIDPSDGPDQIRRLLELLRAAFDENDPEYANTSITLAAGDNHSELVMQITCILPKPLKSLKWPMHLKKCPQSSLATELVLPLVQAHEARSRDLDQLANALREKDGIIARLIDKLEATGTGLEHVFNTLTGKRKITRAAAEAKIKGLAPFDEAEFSRNRAAETQSSTTRPADVPSLLNKVFSGTNLEYQSDLDLEASPGLDNWWMRLDIGKHIVLAHRSGAKQAKTKSDNDNASNTASDDDDDTNAYNHDANARDSPTKDRDGHNTDTRVNESDVETSTDDDDDHTNVSPPPKPAPRRGGLGRIGGQPREKTPVTEPERSRSPFTAGPSEEPSHSQGARVHKLGVIGKKPTNPETSAQVESGSDDERGRNKIKATAAPKKEPPRRETSQERADRKRAELQKELEKKAAAGPAKKKRKF